MMAENPTFHKNGLMKGRYISDFHLEMAEQLSNLLINLFDVQRNYVPFHQYVVICHSTLTVMVIIVKTVLQIISFTNTILIFQCIDCQFIIDVLLIITVLAIIIMLTEISMLAVSWLLE